MNELSTILNQLEKAKNTASIDPDAPEYAKTRAGISVAIQNAKDSLPGLLKQYESALLKHGVAIFLFGSKEKTAEFARLVVDMGEAVAVDAGEMYRRLAEALERSLGASREVGTTQLSVLQTRLADIGREVGWIVRPNVSKQPTFGVLTDLESIMNWVRYVSELQVGESLAVEYIRRKFVTEAEKIRYMLNVAPVIFVNATPEEANKLGPMFGKGSANIDIPEDAVVDQEYVNSTFHRVSKTIKNRKQ